jgi:GAF domain-containing protein
MKLLGTRAGTVFALDAETDELVFRVVRGEARARLKGRRMPIDRGIAGWVARTGRPRLVRDVRRDERWWPEVAELIGYPTKDVLAVPLRARTGRLVGVVELLNKRDHAGFGRADRDYLVALSSSVGTLLDNARLLAESQQRNLQLELLAEVSALINSTLEPEAVQRRSLAAAIRLVAAEAGSLLLRDEKTGELYFQMVVGARARQVRRARLAPGEGIAGWVVEHDRPQVVHDCRTDARWSSRVDRKSRFQTRNLVCVPVRHKGRVIGALQALNKKKGRFDADDLDMLAALADQVATALANARLYEQLQATLYQTSEALAESIEVRDAYTGGHTRRVVELSLAIARRLKLPDEELERLRLAAILHDIGKIGVDDRVLRKPGRLEGDEVRQMKRHPLLGEEILAHIGYLAPALPGIRSHHERHDGRGYPDGLADDAIPLIARIIAVADTYDAMTSDRPYRRGLDATVAAAEIRSCAGSQFDPRVARAFARAYRGGEIGPRAGAARSRRRGGRNLQPPIA